MWKKVIRQLNIIGQCRSYGIPLWQCPQFLFVLMGLIILGASLTSFLIGSRFITDPYVVALVDIGITTILLIISFIITRSFEKLAEASRMKSEFIGIISHQLRSPITNIKWVTNFLTSEDIAIGPEKKEEYFKSLEDNIARMVELVDSLLVTARIEQGSFPVRKKLSSLEDLVKELIERSKVSAEASAIKVEFYPEKDLPPAFFDPALIKLAVESLIDNAIRYTKKDGRIKIWVTRERRYLQLKISDTGVGIPKQDQKHIFQKFFRSENELKEKTKGSGLGLYIASSIIKESGGRIWFESEDDPKGPPGTTFYFTIPIK